MNKLIFTKVNIFLSTIALAVFGFVVSASAASAEISGRYLTADLSGSDLLGIFSSHPYLFWTVLIILIILLVGYGIYHLTRKKVS